MKLISTPPPTIQVKKPPSSPEHKPSSSNYHTTTQKNGLVKHSTPKTHIMENPFKTIKVALIRQKKAVKNEEKSKSGKTSHEDSASCSKTNSEAANKPKLCAVKRVALVKFSPARRSLRGLTSGSRNAANSPRPGRRRNYFEGLQHRRKSPKVRRRHAEPDDSLSSSASTPRRTSIDNTGSTTQRMRMEDKINNNTELPNCENPQTLVDKTSEVRYSDTKLENCTGNTLPLENTPENGTYIRNEVPGTNTSETVTHLYTDKGVVLTRDSLGENNKRNHKQEQGTVQHRVFLGGDKGGNIEGVKNQQDCLRINGVNNNGSGLSKVEVVNAKISSVPSKAAETAKVVFQISTIF